MIKQWLMAAALVMPLAGKLHAAQTPQCAETELLGHQPEHAVVEAHRLFELPTLRYPELGEDDYGFGEFWLILLVDEQGDISCYGTRDTMGFSEATLEPEDLQALAAIDTWRYRPFVVDGSPTAVVVWEYIDGEELPAQQLAAPEVPMTEVMFQLEAFGSDRGRSPRYGMRLYGDGQAEFVGIEYVDVVGNVPFRVPPGVVAALQESAIAKNLWSMRDRYQGGWSHQQSYKITLNFGDESKEIAIDGKPSNMPAAVNEFIDEVHEAASLSRWTNLSPAAMSWIEQSDFDLRSTDGALLFRRAAANRHASDDALLRLIEGGALTRDHEIGDPGIVAARAPLPAALYGRHVQVAERLIADGALETDGQIDTQKVNQAFQNAIAGGSMAAVERVWAATDESSRPSLYCCAQSLDLSAVGAEIPVSALLKKADRDDTSWEGLAIARWLGDHGVDLAAPFSEGQSLLHVAADAEDLALVRYLLALGLDPNRPDQAGRTPLDLGNEDVKLLVLESGADPERSQNGVDGLRSEALRWNWKRVMAWLERPAG